MKHLIFLATYAGLFLLALFGNNTAYPVESASFTPPTDLAKKAGTAFKVKIIESKTVSATQKGSMKVNIAPVTNYKSSRADWSNKFVMQIEPDGKSAKAMNLPYGLYLVQVKGNESRFIDTKGSVFGPGTVTAKQAKTIQVGWANIDFSAPNGPCVTVEIKTDKSHTVQYICPPQKT